MQHFTYRLKEIDTDELLELSGINDSNLKYLKEIYGCDISIRNSDVLFFKEDEEELMKGGVLVYEYYPRYYILPDIDLQDEVFNKLFASKILEALASLRAQATQEVLHNIDLTTDELYTRVRILKRELNTLLKNTIKFSGMTHI